RKFKRKNTVVIIIVQMVAIYYLGILGLAGIISTTNASFTHSFQFSESIAAGEWVEDEDEPEAEEEEVEAEEDAEADEDEAIEEITENKNGSMEESSTKTAEEENSDKDKREQSVKETDDSS